MFPAAVVVRDEHDAGRVHEFLQEFHPAPAGPRELRQAAGEDQALRPAGHGDERVAIERESAVEEILKVGLIPRVAAVHDDGRRSGRIRMATRARPVTPRHTVRSSVVEGELILELGWMTGFEPATSGATVRRSATELHPPQDKLKAEKAAAGAGLLCAC